MYKISAILIAVLVFGTTFATTQAFASSDHDEEIKGPFNGKVVLNKLTEEYVRVITPSNAFLTLHSDD